MQLHMAEYDRRIKEWIKGTGLSSDFAEIKGKNPMLRVELDGMSLLLNISKLSDPKYAKSLALEWEDFKEKN